LAPHGSLVQGLIHVPSIHANWSAHCSFVVHSPLGAIEPIPAQRKELQKYNNQRHEKFMKSECVQQL